ncbi:unnamed protein product, partial [marine sediment metagenome]
MDKAVKDQVQAYFKQQAQIGIPDYIFTSTGYNWDGEYTPDDEDSSRANSGL